MTASVFVSKDVTGVSLRFRHTDGTIDSKVDDLQVHLELIVVVAGVVDSRIVL